jgi:hypothetical protein
MAEARPGRLAPLVARLRVNENMAGVIMAAVIMANVVGRATSRFAAILAVFSRRWGVPASCLAVGLLLGMSTAHIRPPGARGGLDREQSGLLHGLAAQWLDEVRFLREQLNSADGELAIERGARIQLEDQLQASSAAAGQLRQQLDFYEQLFPAGPAGAVAVRSVRVERAAQGLHYRVLLTRSARVGALPFQGGLQFIADSVGEGRHQAIELTPAASLPAPDNSLAGGASGKTLGLEQLRLDFDRYQRNEGILSLPQGFIPAAVTVNVVQEGVVRASQTIYPPF